MDNLILGSITMAFCFITYGFSIRLAKRQNWTWALWLVIIGGLAIRIFASTDLFLHVWDERYHALVAKNLMNDPLNPRLYDDPVLPYDYKIWTENHIWLHKQPFSLWMIAGSLKIFGISEFAVRIPSIIFSTLGIFLMYRLGSMLYSHRIGYISAFLFSMNGLILDLASGRGATDHVDTCFLFMVLLSVVFCVHYAQTRNWVYNLLAGLALGTAILTKWLPALIVLPIWLSLILHYGKFSWKEFITQGLIITGSAVLIFLPWQLYIHETFPLEAAWESSLNMRHLTEIIEERSGGPLYHFNFIRVNYGELIYLPIIWWGYLTFTNKKINFLRLAILLWFLIPFIFFSIAATKMQGYLLFTAPALFLMISDFVVYLSDIRTTKVRTWLKTILVFLFFALPTRYMIERVKPLEKRERNPEWVQELKELGNRDMEKGVLFNYYRPLEAMFYTDLIVYSYIPSPQKIEELLDEGYTVLINNNVMVYDELLENDRIEFIEIDSGNP